MIFGAQSAAEATIVGFRDAKSLIIVGFGGSDPFIKGSKTPRLFGFCWYSNGVRGGSESKVQKIEISTMHGF